MSTTGTSTATASSRTAPTQLLEGTVKNTITAVSVKVRDVRYFFFSTSRGRLITGLRRDGSGRVGARGHSFRQGRYRAIVEGAASNLRAARGSIAKPLPIIE